MKPDRNIVRQIKAYDPYLFVEWNNRKRYFEVWREHVIGRRLITPVTESIYEIKGKQVYAPLDERILWWLYEADSARYKDSKEFALTQDRRFKEFLKVQRQKQKMDFRDRAKDGWIHVSGHFNYKPKAKNSKKPNFNQARPNQWKRPDVKGSYTNRTWYRSAPNAVQYDFKKK